MNSVGCGRPGGELEGGAPVPTRIVAPPTRPSWRRAHLGSVSTGLSAEGFRDMRVVGSDAPRSTASVSASFPSTAARATTVRATARATASPAADSSASATSSAAAASSSATTTAAWRPGDFGGGWIALLLAIGGRVGGPLFDAPRSRSAGSRPTSTAGGTTGGTTAAAAARSSSQTARVAPSALHRQGAQGCGMAHHAH